MSEAVATGGRRRCGPRDGRARGRNVLDGGVLERGLGEGARGRPAARSAIHSLNRCDSRHLGCSCRCRKGCGSRNLATLRVVVAGPPNPVKVNNIHVLGLRRGSGSARTTSEAQNMQLPESRDEGPLVPRYGLINTYNYLPSPEQTASNASLQQFKATFLADRVMRPALIFFQILSINFYLARPGTSQQIKASLAEGTNVRRLKKTINHIKHINQPVLRPGT